MDIEFGGKSGSARAAASGGIGAPKRYSSKTKAQPTGPGFNSFNTCLAAIPLSARPDTQ
jgi:hypothetical protein